MVMPASGPISVEGIQTEFGGVNPIGINEYYRGGGYVPNISQNNNIPTSGTISVGNFYNSLNRIVQTITISSNQTNYVLNTAKVSGYLSGLTDVTLVINSGVYISASSTGVYALDVDTSWAAGDTVTIVNNGFIVGIGGNGGNGGSAYGNYVTSTASTGSTGASGGPAFIARRAVSFQNNGTVAGGGGGGGGGGGAASYSSTDGKGSNPYAAGGGGGGGGRTSTFNSSGGSGGSATAVSGYGTPILYQGNGGGTGTTSSQGGGGSGGSGAGSGGSGGAWGSSGSGGAAGSGGGFPYNNNTATGGGGGPGSGGVAIAGNGNISWVATGTRLGAIT